MYHIYNVFNEQTALNCNYSKMVYYAPMEIGKLEIRSVQFITRRHPARRTMKRKVTWTFGKRVYLLLINVLHWLSSESLFVKITPFKYQQIKPLSKVQFKKAVRPYRFNS